MMELTKEDEYILIRTKEFLQDIRKDYPNLNNNKQALGFLFAAYVLIEQMKRLISE